MNKSQIKPILITILRIAVGWHFLYEGASKLVNVGWSSQSFLAASNSFLAPFYHWLASSPLKIQLVDYMNVYGLLLIGVALFLGILIRYAALSGALLLSLYYFAYPPFGASLMAQGEGSLFIVNRLFIEAAILLVIAFLNEKGYGIDRSVELIRSTKKSGSSKNESLNSGRREALKNLSVLPLLGIWGWGALESRKKYSVDTTSGATIKINQVDISELKGEVPKGKIGNHEISRLVAGGNLIGGWAHSRDLRYVSSLFKAYNTTEKIFETLQLAEKIGINTINIGYPSNPILKKYKDITGSKLKVISQVGHDTKGNNHLDTINQAIDYGVDIIQIIGNSTDVLVRDEKTDVIVKMLDHIRSQGYTAGLGAHSIHALIELEKQGIIPDYYMKTMHHDNYWSAHPKENRSPYEAMGGRKSNHGFWHDNLFDAYPDMTIDFVNRAKVPVMGFKVLAAGAIEPEDGFRWAFQNGADFICVGMFDFQLVHDANLVIDILGDLSGRNRQWYA